ncbi:hypothetical protein BYT27DRAFT_6685950 [Phlegmacium glaucopus]|nr:hypothetical protein BYT27DRAFT_6685950 [Phlegmacium glaucopus]
MRGVVFYCDSENGKIIAIGSDHGVVYLNYLSGRVETLKVGEPDDRIQIVKVVDISGITTIIAACNSTRRSTIAVLKKGSQVSNFKLGQIVKIVLFLSILLMISVLVLKLELVAVKDPSCCGSKISESELWDRISEAERKIEMAMSGNKVVLK